MTSLRTDAVGRFREQMADFARGQSLVELRGHRSQEDVAHEIGVSTKTLRNWEHGGKIRWANAKRIGDFYGVDPEELVSRDDPDETPDLLGPSQLDRIEAKLDYLIASQETDPEGEDRSGDLPGPPPALRPRNADRRPTARKP